MFNPGLQIGDVINNDKLCEIFGCSPQGGMRKSNSTNTLVIVADYVKGIYHDKWIGGVLHYTGMGLNGDQDIDYRQNHTLNHADQLGVDVFLFEVMEEREYTYCGRVEMVDQAYPDTQPDETGVNRRVWMFPIRPVPDNDVKKPPLYVFEDMDDYIARGQNVDKEYAESRKKKNGSGAGQTEPPKKPVVDTEKIINDHIWLIGKRLKHKLFGLGVIKEIVCDDNGDVYLLVAFERELAGKAERKLGYEECKKRDLIIIL